jgi:hypothetical protein
LSGNNKLGESNEEILEFVDTSIEQASSLSCDMGEEDEDEDEEVYYDYKEPSETVTVNTPLGRIEINNINGNLRLSELIHTFSERLNKIV